MEKINEHLQTIARASEVIAKIENKNEPNAELQMMIHLIIEVGKLTAKAIEEYNNGEEPEADQPPTYVDGQTMPIGYQLPPKPRKVMGSCCLSPHGNWLSIAS